MGVVNPSQSNPGDTIEADDINTPVNQLAAVINGNIETVNLADSAVTTAKIADGSVTNAKLATSSGELGGAWQSFTPTPTSGGVGTGGSLTGKYTKVGKTVYFAIYGTLGASGWSMGLAINLPVTAADSTNIIGTAVYTDVGVADYGGILLLNSTTSLSTRIITNGTNGRLDATSNSNPFTWGAGDKFILRGSYEAA